MTSQRFVLCVHVRGVWGWRGEGGGLRVRVSINIHSIVSCHVAVVAALAVPR